MMSSCNATAQSTNPSKKNLKHGWSIRPLIRIKSNDARRITAKAATKAGVPIKNEGHNTRSLQAYLGHRNIQNTTAPAPDRFKSFWRD
jgi:hypothetical protein